MVISEATCQWLVNAASTAVSSFVEVILVDESGCGSTEDKALLCTLMTRMSCYFCLAHRLRVTMWSWPMHLYIPSICKVERVLQWFSYFLQFGKQHWIRVQRDANASKWVDLCSQYVRENDRMSRSLYVLRTRIPLDTAIKVAVTKLMQYLLNL